MKIILGSQSPRRREILRALGLEFEVLAADIDESCALTAPGEYVMEVCRRKACAVYKLAGMPADSLIVTADTAVAVGDEILGKPADKADASRMLKMLSGRTHEVVTGVTVRLGEKMLTDCETTYVTFKMLTDAQIERYVSTDEPYDKAGAYAVQGVAAEFIERIDGSYNNVVGFPDGLFTAMTAAICKCQ